MEKKLTVGSCFSGIGGIELGLEWTGGFETKWQIEKDDYATTILKEHWPNVKCFQDITSVDPGELDRVDIVCGGYPCQPFSIAGQQRGTEDKRHLWPYLFRIIRHLRPSYALLENVPNHLRVGFGEVLADLASIGFDAQWDCIPAAAVGADHLRDRVFLLAYPTSKRRRVFRPLPPYSDNEVWPFENQWGKKRNPRHSTLVGLRMDSLRRASQSGIQPMANGIPERMGDQLRCLGNAVVPQVAQKVGEMILESMRGADGEAVHL